MISLIFNNACKLAFDTQYGVLNVDASVEENHSRNSVATENPIQDGSDVSDHIYFKPKEIAISGIISDAPSRLADSLDNLLNSINGTDAKSRAAYEFFDRLILSKTLFTLVTGLTSYVNCCILNFNIIRNAQSGRSLTFQATIRALNLVTTDIVANVPPQYRDQASPPVDYGKQPGIVVDGRWYENVESFIGTLYEGTDQ